MDAYNIVVKGELRRVRRRDAEHVTAELNALLLRFNLRAEIEPVNTVPACDHSKVDGCGLIRQQ